MFVEGIMLLHLAYVGQEIVKDGQEMAGLVDSSWARDR